MGGGSAPKSDPNMGKAALMSAQTGQDMLAWAKGQAETTNAWAAEDRDRNINTFRPIEDQFIADSMAYDTEGRRAQEAARSEGAVLQQLGAADGARKRSQAAMGIRPDSGRSMALDRQTEVQKGLAVAGAGEMARRNVEQTGYSRAANIVNLGQGGAVNPATSMGLSNSSGSAGYQGAMSGYGQQANILNADYEQQMKTYQANQSNTMGLMSGLGSIAGLMISDENAKTDKAAATGSLGAVRNMRVDTWKYKPEYGDPAEHTGTYAQDFQRETGMGDGRSIPVVDAIGITMGAVKELADKVDALGAVRPNGRRKASAPKPYDRLAPVAEQQAA